MAMKNTDHQDALELLPWFLNGTLSGEEAERVRNCVENSPEMQSDADDADALFNALGDDVPVPMLTHKRIKSVMARLDEQPQHSNPISKLIVRFRSRLGHVRSKRHTRRPFGLGGPIPIALAAAIALLAIVLIVPQPNTGEGEYRTVTDKSEGRPSVPIQVELAENVSGADAKALFEELSFDAKRQADGTYRVDVPEDISGGELFEILQTLRSDGRVADARALTEGD